MTARFLKLTLACVLLGAAAPLAGAAERSEAELYFELNDSAGDLGIHSSIDGGPYTTLEREDARGRVILWLGAFGRLAQQGMPPFFLESAEPSFAELAPAAFFRRFPEGTYDIEAVGRDGVEFEAEVELSHVMAARPGNTTANGVPAVNCDAPTLPSISAPVRVDWDPVTQSHPTVGQAGQVEIVRYESYGRVADHPPRVGLVSSRVIGPRMPAFLSYPPALLSARLFSIGSLR